MSRSKLFLSEGDALIELSGVTEIEKILDFTFPGTFKDLYLASNGGVPSRTVWNEDIYYEPIVVSYFKPLRAGSPMLDGDMSHLVGFILAMRHRKVIPDHILPFALDEAGNFICFEKASGTIVYFAVDVFQPDVEMALNHVAAQKLLSHSFDEFCESLLVEELDEEE